MNPLLIIPIFFGGMILITGIVMVACIPVFKSAARQKREREEQRLRLKEEKETQRLRHEQAKKEMDLEIQRAQAQLQLQKDREAMAVFCPYCGGKHTLEDKFCTNCGASLK